MTKYINQHIIRINYQSALDVRNTENMIEYIKLVIRKETGTEPEIEEYLL